MSHYIPFEIFLKLSKYWIDIFHALVIMIIASVAKLKILKLHCRTMQNLKINVNFENSIILVLKQVIKITSKFVGVCIYVDA